MYLGVYNPRPGYADLADRAAVTTQLEAIARLGCDLVIQDVLYTEPANSDALFFRAECARLHLTPVFAIRNGDLYNPAPGALGPQREYMSRLRPAHFSIFDEPEQELTLTEIQTIWTTLRDEFPDCVIGGFHSGRIPTFGFAGDEGHFVGININPFSTDDQQALDEGLLRLDESWKTIQPVQPGVPLWVDLRCEQNPAQKWRTPTAQEMINTFQAVRLRYNVQALTFSPWSHTLSEERHPLNDRNRAQLRSAIATCARYR